MSTSVHILCTVRKPALLPAAQLVFKTLKVGFPSAAVCVYGNGLKPELGRAIRSVMPPLSSYRDLEPTSHDAWIEGLIMNSHAPFWICDTDLVFFDAVEQWGDEWTGFAGRYEPEFIEEWTRTRHVARLHTCLMYLNPAVLKPAMRAWMAVVPAVFGGAQANLIRQQFIPTRLGPTLFYDTCAGLYQALDCGRPFEAGQDIFFEHLHCGTYADLISPHLSLNNLAEAHQAIYADPSRARGLQQEQAKYYDQRRPEVVLKSQP